MIQTDGFLLLAEQLPEGMLLVAADGEILAVNRVALRQFEKKAEQLVGFNLAELTGLPREKIREKLKPCSRSRRPMRLAFHCSRPDSVIKIPD